MDDKERSLSQHTEDELVARYVALREGPARLAILDELARRGVAWAAGMAEFEREQAASNRLARRHITDLPEVRSNHADSAEAIEDAAGVRHTVGIDRPGMWLLRSKASPCAHPNQDSGDGPSS